MSLWACGPKEAVKHVQTHQRAPRHFWAHECKHAAEHAQARLRAPRNTAQALQRQNLARLASPRRDPKEAIELVQICLRVLGNRAEAFDWTLKQYQND